MSPPPSLSILFENEPRSAPLIGFDSERIPRHWYISINRAYYERKIYAALQGGNNHFKIRGNEFACAAAVYVSLYVPLPIVEEFFCSVIKLQ
jgi:hypothetical protein